MGAIQSRSGCNFAALTWHAATVRKRELPDVDRTYEQIKKLYAEYCASLSPNAATRPADMQQMLSDDVPGVEDSTEEWQAFEAANPPISGTNPLDGLRTELD